MTPQDLMRAQMAGSREEAQKIINADPREELVAHLEVLHEFASEMRAVPSDFLEISERLLPHLIDLAKAI